MIPSIPSIQIKKFYITTSTIIENITYLIHSCLFIIIFIQGKSCLNLSNPRDIDFPSRNKTINQIIYIIIFKSLTK
jgi:hypothetical protein